MQPDFGRSTSARVASLYLELLKTCLTRTLFVGDPVDGGSTEYSDGRDYPEDAETMIGLRRLDNLEDCICNIVEDDVPGDLIETGVWRGGAAIFMRAVLAALGDDERRVWLADSFQGFPQPDPRSWPADDGDPHWTLDHFAVPVEVVRRNFRRYGLFDDRVVFVHGFFRDTLPAIPVERLALMRLDADTYEATTLALEWLYPRLSPGGYVIVDDYGAVEACRDAVTEFRRRNRVSAPLVEIDWTGVFWRRDHRTAGPRLRRRGEADAHDRRAVSVSGSRFAASRPDVFAGCWRRSMS